MKLETFFEKFELFADAPNAVRRMRELVLDLAVSGKILGSFEGKSNGDLPHGWRRMLLGEVAKFINGDRSKNYPSKSFRVDSGVPFINAGHLVNGGIDLSDMDYITNDHYERLGGGKVERGDVLYCLRGSLGKGAVVQGITKGAIASSLLILRPNHLVASEFLFLFLGSSSGKKQIAEFDNGSAQPNLSASNVKKFVAPIPPLPEQKRIVAKVDELMALCDRLEAQQNERQTRHTALARAAVSRFAEAPTPATLEYLFHPSYAITPGDLRKTILTLAVQGKLVQQDPNDEPSGQCLARLGLVSTSNPLDEEGLLPSTWAAVRFEDVAVVSGGVTLGRKLGDRKTVLLPYLRVANVKRGETDLAVMKEVAIAEDEIERYALRENDLLMTEGGDWDKVGRAAIWRGEIPVCLHQNHVFRARMRADEMEPLWFERYFNSPAGRGYFESAAKQTTNLASINMRQVRGCPVPFPPLAEQRRIVAKVDELMKLVDKLEAQLTLSSTKAEQLMQAIVAELTAADLKLKSKDRSAIACYVLHRMRSNPSFGRTAEMKVLYLAEAHLGLPLGGEYFREAAGPFDKWIYDFERRGEKEGWFEVSQERLTGGRAITRYHLLPAIQSKVDAAIEELERARESLDRLLEYLKPLNTEDIEIVATLFAVWNDAVLDGVSPDDDWIIREVRGNWHPSKQRFATETLSRWLAWMRKHDLVPTGKGRRTQYQSGFELVD